MGTACVCAKGLSNEDSISPAALMMDKSLRSVKRMPAPDAAGAHGFQDSKLSPPLFLSKPAFFLAVELPEK